MRNRSTKAYEAVEAAIAKNPKLTIRAAMKKLGVTNSAYYYGRTASLKDKPALTKQRTVAAIKPTTEAGKLMVLIGTPDQIREVIQ